MTAQFMTDAKVYTAAAVGVSTPGVNFFLDNATPVLKTVLLLGQIGVATVTILYIFSKWKQLRKARTDSKSLDKPK